MGSNNGSVLWIVFSIQSSIYGTTTVAKVSVFSTWMRFTVSVQVKIDPYSSSSVIYHPNLSFFLSLVNVSVIIGTRVRCVTKVNKISFQLADFAY